MKGRRALATTEALTEQKPRQRLSLTTNIGFQLCLKPNLTLSTDSKS